MILRCSFLELPLINFICRAKRIQGGFLNSTDIYVIVNIHSS